MCARLSTSNQTREGRPAMADDQQYPEAGTPPPGPARHRGPRRLFDRPVLLAVVAAVAIGLVVGVILGVFGGSDAADDSANQAATPNPSVLPSETPSAEPPSPTATVTVPSTAGSPSGTATSIVVPVYYLGRNAEPGNRHFLYREFRRVQTEGSNDSAAVAVQAMLSLPPLDPDYTSPWPAGASLIELDRSGDTAVVVLSDEVATHRTDAQTATLAAQQLVYTVTAADRSVHSVRLVVGNRETSSLFGHSVGTPPLSRAAEADVVAPVWIIDPYQGAQVGRTFTVHGTANVFEAAVSYRVLRDGAVVRSGAVQASAGSGTRGEWSVQLTLAAGRYVVEAFETSAENGQPLFVDSKSVRIG
jgi:spore germination protein GerM